MSEPKTYTGGCHCGAVRFEAHLDLTQGLITCNCSMCGKTGAILAFIPADQFTLHKGEENLTDYQFNKKVIHHLFCKTCGIRPFGRGDGYDGKPSVAVNVRCLDDVDPATLSPKLFDGKSR